MQISFEELRRIIKSVDIPVYRDEAPVTAKYPYIVYEFVSEIHKRASNRVICSMPLYQISLITNGIEKDYLPLKRVLDQNKVSYSEFETYPFDENDNTITQYITYVRCIHNG